MAPGCWPNWVPHRAELQEGWSWGGDADIGVEWPPSIQGRTGGGRVLPHQQVLPSPLYLSFFPLF